MYRAFFRFLPSPVLFLCLAVIGIGSAQAQQSYKPEYIVITGGPSLIEWEKFKRVPHDHWWANFAHASRIRLDELRQTYGDNALITWLVYKPSYVRRGVRQEKTDLLTQLQSIQQKFKLHLVYFNTKQQLLDYLNAGQPRDAVKIADLEYFGHSNRACFMFDYSNEIDSGSKNWLHETELNLISRNDFAPRAFIKSWGCHTGESMSRLWRKATGQHMIGAIGTTDYSGSDEPGWHPKLGKSYGRWVD
jgi:hypothetical protein